MKCYMTKTGCLRLNLNKKEREEFESALLMFMSFEENEFLFKVLTEIEVSRLQMKAREKFKNKGERY